MEDYKIELKVTNLEGNVKSTSFNLFEFMFTKEFLNDNLLTISFDNIMEEFATNSTQN